MVANEPSCSVSHPKDGPRAARLMRQSVAEGHDIARDVRHQVLHHLPHLGSVMVHVDPYGQGGEQHHRVGPHAHDDLPLHSHE